MLPGPGHPPHGALGAHRHAGGASASPLYFLPPNAGGHGYVWHCHIVDHEDNEMMRPDSVQPLPNVTRTYVQGVDY